MRIKYENYEDWRERVSKWHKVFAWFPVKTATHIVWLTSVERRFLTFSYDGGIEWEYRQK